MVRPRRPRACLSRSVPGPITPAESLRRVWCNAGVLMSMVNPHRPQARLFRSVPEPITPAGSLRRARCNAGVVVVGPCRPRARLSQSVPGGFTPAESLRRAWCNVGGVIITMVSPRRPRARLSRSVPGGITPAGSLRRARCNVGVVMATVRPRRPRALSWLVLGMGACGLLETGAVACGACLWRERVGFLNRCGGSLGNSTLDAWCVEGGSTEAKPVHKSLRLWHRRSLLQNVGDIGIVAPRAVFVWLYGKTDGHLAALWTAQGGAGF